MEPSVRSVAALGLLAFVLAGCGGSGTAPVTPSSRLEAVPGTATKKIVLTQLGAMRLGIQTATVHGGRRTSIPIAAVVYDPGGATFAFTSPAPRTYEEVPITIDHVAGSSVYLRKGPRPGARVVTLGAEELFGVQTGVLAQT